MNAFRDRAMAHDEDMRPGAKLAAGVERIFGAVAKSRIISVYKPQRQAESGALFPKACCIVGAIGSEYSDHIERGGASTVMPRIDRRSLRCARRRITSP